MELYGFEIGEWQKDFLSQRLQLVVLDHDTLHTVAQVHESAPGQQKETTNRLNNVLIRRKKQLKKLRFYSHFTYPFHSTSLE